MQLLRMKVSIRKCPSHLARPTASLQFGGDGGATLFVVSGLGLASGPLGRSIPSSASFIHFVSVDSREGRRHLVGSFRENRAASLSLFCLLLTAFGGPCLPLPRSRSAQHAPASATACVHPSAFEPFSLRVLGAAVAC